MLDQLALAMNMVVCMSRQLPMLALRMAMLMALLMGLADDRLSFSCGRRQIEANTASETDTAVKDKKDADVSKGVESKDVSKEKEKGRWAKLGLESSAMSALEEKLQEVAVRGLHTACSTEAWGAMGSTWKP